MKHYHLIGVGGIGMSGLASLLIACGYSVSGSDVKNSPLIEKLKISGVDIIDCDNISTIDSNTIVVYSTAIGKDNPQYLAAASVGAIFMHRAELLSELSSSKKIIAVTGVHGKTFSSSLMVKVLHSCGENPSYAVGGIIKDFDSNASVDSGKFFVVEADESDESFVAFNPCFAIITNVEYEHAEHYRDVIHMKEAFRNFASRVSSMIFFGGDRGNLNDIRGVSYGFDNENDVVIKHCKRIGLKLVFDIEISGKIFKDIVLNNPLKHNAENAAGVFACALTLGCDEDEVRGGFASFQGVERRFEILGDRYGITFIDDYAHHPTEIMKTLENVREIFPTRRIVVIFQPHRFSRLKIFFEEFSKAFCRADIVFVTDVYSAGENPIDGISGKAIATAIGNISCNSCRHEFFEDLRDTLQGFLKSGDVAITLGAGTVTCVLRSFFAKCTINK